jgi:hypothetical protein
MKRQKSAKRGWILGGVFGALVAAGLFMMIPGASALSGTGSPGALVLESNSRGSQDQIGGTNTPNLASAATDLDATPNFGNYVAYGRYVFGVDATPSQIGNIDAIHAAGQGIGTGVAASSDSGVGVSGTSARGVGVEAVGTSGTALDVQGRSVFSRSGRAVVPAHHAFVSHSDALRPAAMVLATIQGNVPGVYIQGVTIKAGAHGSFTIHLNEKTPKSVAVVWMVLN